MPLCSRRDRRVRRGTFNWRDKKKQDSARRCGLFQQVAEAVEIEVKAMPVGPFVLDTIGLVNVKQILADHRYDQILRCHNVERRSETTCHAVGEAVINGQRVSALDCDGDGGTLACAEASGGGQGGEEAEFFSGGNGNEGEGPGVERGSEASAVDRDIDPILR